MKLSPQDLINAYDRAKMGREDAFGQWVVFAKDGGDYLEMLFLNGGSYKYILDNYPFPRKHFSTSIPIRSIKEFESDLIRMDIPIPIRKKPDYSIDWDEEMKIWTNQIDQNIKSKFKAIES